MIAVAVDLIQIAVHATKQDGVDACRTRPAGASGDETVGVGFCPPRLCHQVIAQGKRGGVFRVSLERTEEPEDVSARVSL